MKKFPSVFKSIPTRHLLLAASILMFLVIVSGGVLRANGASSGCLDWLTCFGSLSMPDSANGSIDYVHRLSTLITSLVVLAIAVSVWRQSKRSVWLRYGMVLVVSILIVEIGLGGWQALQSGISVPTWTSTLHLGLALTAQAALLVATVLVSLTRQPAGNAGVKLSIRTPFSRLSILTLGSVLLLLVSGSIVAAIGTPPACNSWPLCGPELIPGDLVTWLHFTHRAVVVMAGSLLLALLVQAWRKQREQTAILLTTTTAAVLFFAQALLGAKLVEGFPAYMLVLHQATASAIWGVMVVQVTVTLLKSQNAAVNGIKVNARPKGVGLLKDLLMLTKPIVVALLLVTTFAGMVIGAREWPSLPLVFWTLIGGFMAAGGSGAINQYIDREDDSKMQRTQKRPIPSGRLTPAEGLAFGAAMALTSFYLMVAFVNWLAAVLCLAGIIYYVLIYSIFLKKTTVQNIVIGGGAGAIPPLVGWAAATGGLNIPSLFLFAVIFMWTPPHFWALALVRQKDYARAGVPMLPVVRGERETRWQIWIYTIELVGLTLLLPIFGLGGAVYLVGAGVLGLWLLAVAWRVWKQGGNKLAWKMYRYSSMYLAFLFLVLMVDRLL